MNQIPTFTAVKKIKRRVNALGKAIFDLEDEINSLQELQDKFSTDEADTTEEYIDRQFKIIALKKDKEQLDAKIKPLFDEYKGAKELYNNEKKHLRRLKTFYYT